MYFISTSGFGQHLCALRSALRRQVRRTARLNAAFFACNFRCSMVYYFMLAGVMELADVVDSKSTASDGVPVRVRPPARKKPELLGEEIGRTGFFYM